jgi:WD40 repeat protein
MKPSDKLSIAGHAWKEKDSNPSKAALLKSFNYAIMNPGTDSGLLQLSGKYSRNFAPASSTIGFASCSEDYRYIFGYTEDTVFIWKTDGTIYSKFRCGDAPPATVRMSDNGVYIGCLGTDSLLKVWDVIGNLRFTRKICYQKLQADKSFRFTKDDNVFTLTPDHDAILLDLNGNLLQTFDHHKGNVNALDLSNDNIFLATASSDSTINIWYLNSETKKYEFYNTLNKHKNGVRSVDFAPNNRYLVSVSIDNSVKVTSINNLVVSTFRDDLRLYYSVPVGYPLSAEFDRTGTAVVITSYPDSVIRRERMIGIYFDSYIHNTTIGENSLFDFVTFSPDKKYFAYKSGEDISLASRTTFNIYSPNNYRLFQIEGDKPFFSPDGKYLYSVCGNQIKCWFIDIDIISLIALQWYRNWHMQS